MKLLSPVGFAKTAVVAAALAFSPVMPDAAIAGTCGIPGGPACAGKPAVASPFWSSSMKKVKSVNTAAFPKCTAAMAKDKPCPGGAGFRLEGDKRVMAGGIYKGDKGGVGGSGDLVNVREPPSPSIRTQRPPSFPIVLRMHMHVC